ncbi:hypothetical protein ABZ746_06810 [Streptomyces sp. NPDC020096]
MTSEEPDAQPTKWAHRSRSYKAQRRIVGTAGALLREGPVLGGLPLVRPFGEVLADVLKARYSPKTPIEERAEEVSLALIRTGEVLDELQAELNARTAVVKRLA